MKDPGDNRAILSSARNRVTAQRMRIKRMSIVCFKIRTVPRICFSCTTWRTLPTAKLNHRIDLFKKLLVCSHLQRDERNVLWRPKGWATFGIWLRWEVFQFAVPSMDPKRDFKTQWKFHRDSTRERRGELPREAPNFTINEVLSPPSPFLEKSETTRQPMLDFFSPFKAWRRDVNMLYVRNWIEGFYGC